MTTNLAQKIWKRIIGERAWVNRYGTLRERERYSLIPRANYHYGMLRAADVAKYFGKKSVTVIEFGVASGAGLLNMISLAPAIENETGVQLRIVGFDTGKGLPSVSGYKDHPEIWNTGDFAMEDRAGLERKIAGRAEIRWGDIAETIGPFTETLNADCPLGFVSIDVDIYSGTKSALQCLQGAPEKYNPAVSMYFDDVKFFFANAWAGELLAINEFNAEHMLRKIDRDHSLPSRRYNSYENWYSSMYACHIFDHEARQKPQDRGELVIREHFAFMASQNLL